MRWRGWFWLELWGDEGGVEQSRNCGDVAGDYLAECQGLELEEVARGARWIGYR